MVLLPSWRSFVFVFPLLVQPLNCHGFGGAPVRSQRLFFSERCLVILIDSRRWRRKCLLVFTCDYLTMQCLRSCDWGQINDKSPYQENPSMPTYHIITKGSWKKIQKQPNQRWCKKRQYQKGISPQELLIKITMQEWSSFHIQLTAGIINRQRLVWVSVLPNFSSPHL